MLDFSAGNCIGFIDLVYMFFVADMNVRPFSDPPAVEPVYTEIRQGLGRPFSLSCRVLRAHPSRVLTYEWKLGTRLLTTGKFDTRDETEYHVRALNREGYGAYTCDITNEAGAGRCTFLVTGNTIKIHVQFKWMHLQYNCVYLRR